MKHPTKKQFQKVIDIMYSVLPLTFEEGARLNMMETEVNCNGHICGTTHCFAGWFAVGALNAGLLRGKIYFNDGAELMARMLGFALRIDLKLWTRCNAHIWGNDNGDGLFCDSAAFISPHRPHGAQNVTDIIHHLEDVQSRLPG